MNEQIDLLRRLWYLLKLAYINKEQIQYKNEYEQEYNFIMKQQDRIEQIAQTLDPNYEIMKKGSDQIVKTTKRKKNRNPEKFNPESDWESMQLITEQYGEEYWRRFTTQKLVDYFLTKPEIPTFGKYLHKTIILRKFKISDVVILANMDRGHFYQILRGERIPKRDTIIKLALVLKLDIQRTNRLLSLAGHNDLNQLNSHRDEIIWLSFWKSKTLDQTNELLEYAKQKEL